MESYKNIVDDISIPLFFILSKGSDPTDAVVAFANSLGFSKENKKYD